MRKLGALVLTMVLGVTLAPAQAAEPDVAVLAGRTTLVLTESGAARLRVPTDVAALSVDFSEAENIDSLVLVGARDTADGPRTEFFLTIYPAASGGSTGARSIFEDESTSGGVDIPTGDYTIYAATQGGTGARVALLADGATGDVEVPLDRPTNARIRMLDATVPATNPATFAYAGGGEDTIASDNGFVFVGGWARSPAHVVTESGVCFYDDGAPAAGYLPGCPGGEPIFAEVVHPAAASYRSRFYGWHDNTLRAGPYAVGYFTSQPIPASEVGIFGAWLDFDH